MNDITIRSIQDDDAIAIRELNIQLGYEFGLEATRERVRQMAPESGNSIFVACRGNQVVGYIQLTPYDQLFRKPLLNVMALVVDKDARRLGVGGRLLAMAETQARAAGCQGIRLDSGVERSDAHAFYLNQGFQETKTHKSFLKEI